MFIADVYTLFFLFAIGLIVGLLPPFLWGLIGGDEGIVEGHPHLSGFLKLIHHWQIGVAIVICTILVHVFLTTSPFTILFAGWGTSTAIDDIMFHSFEHYFERLPTPTCEN